MTHQTPLATTFGTTSNRKPHQSPMRMGFGPGFQAGGPSDRTLRLLAGMSNRCC